MKEKFKLCCLVFGLSQLFSCGQNNQLNSWLGDDQKLSQEDSTIMSKWLLENGLNASDFNVIEAPNGHRGDFSVIVSEQSIQSIRASRVKVLSGLSQLSSLQSLELNHFNQPDLSNCPVQLKALRLTGNDLTSLQGVESCRLLEEIKVVHSSVTGLEPLLELPQLFAIKINFSQLTSVDINHSAPLLKSLDLSNNQINQFAVNADLPQLNLLILDNNRLSALDISKYTPELKVLSVSNNLIQDLNKITPINSLSRIALKANPLNDLTALQTWPNLQTIDFDGKLLDTTAPINRKISHANGPLELQLAEAEYLKKSYLENSEFIESLSQKTGGQAYGVSKKISSHFDLHSDPTVSGHIKIDAMNGLMRLPVVSTNDLLQFDRKLVMRGKASVKQGSLNIYSPTEQDFWDMAKLFVDTPFKQRPKDRDDLVIKGFTVNRVSPGETVEFSANLVAIAGKYFLLLGPEQGEVSGIHLEFE